MSSITPALIQPFSEDLLSIERSKASREIPSCHCPVYSHWVYSLPTYIYSGVRGLVGYVFCSTISSVVDRAGYTDLAQRIHLYGLHHAREIQKINYHSLLGDKLVAHSTNSLQATLRS